jgi:hypothetical protein
MISTVTAMDAASSNSRTMMMSEESIQGSIFRSKPAIASITQALDAIALVHFLSAVRLSRK